MSDENRKRRFRDWRPRLPERHETAGGEPRRVGVELELIGLDVPAVSRIVARRFGLTIEKKSRYEFLLAGDEAGDWAVELDFEYLKEKGREDVPEDELAAFLGDAAESVLRAGAEFVVPVEVVSPPLPMPRLADVQLLVEDLRDAGARGTGAGFSYAFGLQFNPELPNLQAKTIVSYLKAFFCLHDWLVERSAPDFTRRLTRFSAPFPARYLRKVIDSDYWPDRDKLIDDYLADNPTRNRSLDLLPLFLHLDEERVRSVVDDPRVKARPTLHYRLPNCEIDKPDWGIDLAWNDWLAVEALAADPECLNELCAQYVRWIKEPLSHVWGNWADEVEAWIDNGAR
ncbi:MAG: amidoligase family protein [Xanthomonadales bacterium]|nr:amidoligase family protein [Xanthomonadales bacterium]